MGQTGRKKICPVPFSHFYPVSEPNCYALIIQEKTKSQKEVINKQQIRKTHIFVSFLLNNAIMHHAVIFSYLKDAFKKNISVFALLWPDSCKLKGVAFSCDFARNWVLVFGITTYFKALGSFTKLNRKWDQSTFFTELFLWSIINYTTNPENFF